MPVCSKHDARGRCQRMLLALLLCSTAATAQVTVGNNVNLSLKGELGYGYSANYGNLFTTSSHDQGINGTGDLNGYYFNPNFISFNIRPYYDRNQSNTEAQNILGSTGISTTATFF